MFVVLYLAFCAPWLEEGFHSLSMVICAELPVSIAGRSTSLSNDLGKSLRSGAFKIPHIFKNIRKITLVIHLIGSTNDVASLVTNVSRIRIISEPSSLENARFFRASHFEILHLKMKTQQEDLKTTTQDLKTQLADMTLMYNQHVAASDQVEAELEQQLEQAQKEADLWRRRADKYQDELQLVRGNMTALARQVNTLQDQLTTTNQTVHTTQLARVNAENDVDQLTSQVRVMEASIERLESQLDDALEDKALLTCELEDLQTDFETTCERLRADIVDLQSELLAVQSTTPKSEEGDHILHKAELVKLQTQMDQIQLDAFETTQELIEKAEQVQCAQNEVFPRHCLDHF